MKLNKAYKFRLYPSEDQEQKLRQHGGNTRYLWNYFLELNQQEYEKNNKFIFAYDLNMKLPSLKKEHKFLGLSFSQSLQAVGRHFDKALKDFLDPTQQKEFPVKKKKFERDSFTVPQKFRIENNYVFIPKIGEVQWAKHRPIKGKVKHITIKQDGDQWHCSVNCLLKIKKPIIKTDDIIGIDVGVKTFATHSDGEIVENQKITKKYEKKLKRNQRKLSRRTKGSNNRNKQRVKVSKIHRKIRNTRKDFQHKTTKSTIAKCDGIVLENINISGMMKNHCLAKAIGDCAWYEYKRQIKYKCHWYGKVYLEIDRFEPTSKCCSCCGWKDNNLTLKDRIFHCQECGLVIDRDLNAAINIKNCGIRLLWEAQEASACSNTRTLEETRGYRASAQCLSMNQEKEGISPSLLRVN